jgi:predicted glycogen debranching enzyme
MSHRKLSRSTSTHSQNHENTSNHFQSIEPGTKPEFAQAISFSSTSRQPRTPSADGSQYSQGDCSELKHRVCRLCVGFLQNDLIVPNQHNRDAPMNSTSSKEWLEADGLGGFASGTDHGIRTRRYHALLLTATTPPTGRVVLVNGFDAWIETPSGRYALTSQRYAPDIISPDGTERIVEFTHEPWPKWKFRCEDGTEVEQELFVEAGKSTCTVLWRILGERRDVKLFVRPFLSGRDYHGLHRENPNFRFDAHIHADHVSWRPYQGLPEVTAVTNGIYTHEPFWYRNFTYEEEQARGLDYVEDLASPGVFAWELDSGDAVLTLTTDIESVHNNAGETSALERALETRDYEALRRKQFKSSLARAADAYIVRGRHGKTIVAGYPWFADWGRDTFIALRGLCIANDRLDDALAILLSWSAHVSEGMLPNRFPDSGEAPEYNSVDASLWFIIAVQDLLTAFEVSKRKSHLTEKAKLQSAVEAILNGYAAGTRFGIRQDEDGLLACGVPGSQLTWMDAKIGDWTVTPRVGKPVEVNALWINALHIGATISPRWQDEFNKAASAFRTQFWNQDRQCLYDVIDCDHIAGRVDASFRPNQIFAIGGLPLNLLPRAMAVEIMVKIEARLLTPLGLRSLAPDEPGYASHYLGGVHERDSVYHQGTVWPWLIGAFVEAWVRLHDNTAEAKQEAREKFLTPLLAHFDETGLGHVNEIADADAPHTPRGCPFQAWSVGELLRLEHAVLTPSQPRPRKQFRQRGFSTANLATEI